MAHDLSHLEKQLKVLNGYVTELHGTGFANELLTIIHQPGFTTPQELFLLTSAVDSLTQQMEGSIKACKQLLEGARMIEKAGAKAA